MAQIWCSANIPRQGTVAGFVLAPGAGLWPVLTKGVCFAQGVMWRPDVTPDPPEAPASQLSWLWYNSETGLYYTATPAPTAGDDALIGWVVTDAEKVILCSTLRAAAGPLQPLALPTPLPDESGWDLSGNISYD